VSFFVTGTDTGVGKTLVSCALLAGLAEKGLRVAGYKPVAAGCDVDGLNDDARQLLAASNLPLAYAQVNPYCLAEPIAPHIAAAHAGVRIEFARILDGYRALAAAADHVVVEGAGGFRIPLGEDRDSADLARELGLGIVLVAGMRLGCLNHALLTAEAVAARGLALAGWVANVRDENMPALEENIAALQQRIAAPLLGVIPFLSRPRPAAVRLDIEQLLKGEKTCASS
jgi:dethiobiotin synthetase